MAINQNGTKVVANVSIGLLLRTKPNKSNISFVCSCHQSNSIEITLLYYAHIVMRLACVMGTHWREQNTKNNSNSSNSREQWRLILKQKYEWQVTREHRLEMNAPSNKYSMSIIIQKQRGKNTADETTFRCS